MKLKIFSIAAVLFVGLFYVNNINSTVKKEQTKTLTSSNVYTFQKNVFPMLQSKCQTCHFAGGKMYSKLPFDDSATVFKLGKRLFTRLQKKEQQEIINSWLQTDSKNK